MRKEVYICDYCGKILYNTDPYALEVPYTLKLETITVQDRLEWHYCSDCWKIVKGFLNGKTSFSNLRRYYTVGKYSDIQGGCNG